jgi:adenylosuccinate synthase
MTSNHHPPFNQSPINIILTSLLPYRYGTTTGRARRCGWLDVPQVRYAATLNGFTCVNLTKLDVLTGYATIKIGTRYMQQRQPYDDDDEGEDGKVRAQELPCNYLPASLSQYSSGATYLEYEELPGWQEDISQAKHFSDLPANAQR